MEAPNRSEWVNNIWATKPPSTLIGGSFPNDDVRREYLLGVLLPELNKLEFQATGLRWGYLIKVERDPDFIPSDIICWPDTRVHYDVLTNSGPAWQDDGPMQDVWAIGFTDSTPPVPPVPPDPPPADLQVQINHLTAMIDANRLRMEAINSRFDFESNTVNVHKPLPDYEGIGEGQGKIFGIKFPVAVTVTSRPKE
jgi:hypothetical protein